MNISSNFDYHLANTTIGEIAPQFHKIWSINQSETLYDALKALIEHNISSIPVYGDVRTQLVSIIDYADILSLILEDLENPDKIRDILKNTKISDYVSRSNKRIVTMSQRASIQDAINMFTSYKGTLRRVAVIGDNDTFESILSQSRVVRYIGNRPEYDIGDVANKTVEMVGIGNSPVISISHNEKAINAFYKMFSHNISGIAVIKTKNNKLIGNISLSDIKAIGADAEMASKLILTAKEFVKQQTSDDYPKLMVVTPHDKFMNVFWHLRSKWIHRVYVINNEEERECMSVITLYDILKMYEKKK